MSKLCLRNKKIKKETEKHDFYDFGILPHIYCTKCGETNSGRCLLAEQGLFIIPEEVYES